MPDVSIQVFRVTAGVDQAIRRHGEETYPHECCGALIGTGGHATATVALPNTTEEGPRRRFMVRPSDYRTAEQRWAASCSGFITLIRITRRGRRSTISITRGPRSRTSSSPLPRVQPRP